MSPRLRLGLALPFVVALLAGEAAGQAEVRAWGNVTGLRVEGQLMPFETSLRAVGVRGATVLETAKERQNPSFIRDGDHTVVETALDSLDLRQTVTDVAPGVATIDVAVSARDGLSLEGVYLVVRVPTDLAGGGSVQLLDPETTEFARVRPSHGAAMRGAARGVRFLGPHRQIEVALDAPTEVIVRRLDGGASEALLAVTTGDQDAGQTARRTFTVTASGAIDRRPVEVVVDASRPGRAFDGLGGNFRIQNPRVDPEVIRYNLEHLRVAQGRVEMPWRFWHPEEGVDPIAATQAGDLHPRVAAAMEMAQDLDRRGIPVMIAAWSGPDWALDGPANFGATPEGLRGNALNADKLDEIYDSITAYARYLRDAYGVEAVAFSFNESDLGINVRQTPEEHAALIRGLGARFAAAGLPTKLLLGDTADGNGYAFTYAAAADSTTYPYIHAVSFHSWRGWADETLRRWRDVAERVGVPLIVGEGSTDAAAWRYPAIFEEPVYALEEIDLYARILTIARPQTILQWQLTGDYSVLTGGGVYGNDDEPVRPLRRFWNLKQLASTPPGLPVVPATSNRDDVTVAALGTGPEAAVHLVNNGAEREAVVRGLPATVAMLRVFVTDEDQEMAEGAPVRVVGGEARVTLPAASFTSLLSDVATP